MRQHRNIDFVGNILGVDGREGFVKPIMCHQEGVCCRSNHDFVCDCGFVDAQAP